MKSSRGKSEKARSAGKRPHTLYDSVKGDLIFEAIENSFEKLEFTFVGQLIPILDGGNPSYQQLKKKKNKAYYGIWGSKIYQIKDEASQTIKASLDISFCKYEEFRLVKDDARFDKAMFGICLYRNKQTIKFIASSFKERQQWKNSMMSYVLSDHILNDYQFLEVIGKGAFGQVHLAELNYNNKDDKQEQQVAIKVMNKEQVYHSTISVNGVINEIRVHWAMIQCDNVLKLNALYEDDKNIFMVLEYQKHGSLLDSITKNQNQYFSERQIKYIMEQLLLALDFFHCKKIIHGDIKLDNILISQISEGQYDVRVADFGIAQFLQENQLCYKKQGTPGYVAPEILRDKGYDFKADIFSLGVVFYNLLTKKFIFQGEDGVDILRKNAACKIQHIQQNLMSTSSNTRDLLFKMLSTNVSKRPTAKQALEHPWFNKDQKVIHELLGVNQMLCNFDIQSKSSNHFSDKSFSSFCNKNKTKTIADNSNSPKYLNPHVMKKNHNSEHDQQIECCSPQNSYRVNYYDAISKSRLSNLKSRKGYKQSADILNNNQSDFTPKSKFFQSKIINPHETRDAKQPHDKCEEIKEEYKYIMLKQQNYTQQAQKVKSELELKEEAGDSQKEDEELNELEEQFNLLESMYQINSYEIKEQLPLNETRSIPLQKQMSSFNNPCTTGRRLLHCQ